MSARSRKPQRRRKPCGHCLDLDPNNDSWYEGINGIKHHKVPVASLNETKKKGCQICFAILKGIGVLTNHILPPGSSQEPFTFIELLDLSPSLPRSQVSILLRPGKPLEILAEIYFSFKIRPTKWSMLDRHRRLGTGDSIKFGFEIYTELGKPAPWDGFGPAKHLRPRPNKRKAIIREWMDACQREHPECQHQPSPGSTMAPRRVLDLRGGARHTVRVIDCEGLEGPYAILTYRPTRLIIPRLKTKTLPTGGWQFQVSSLPPAFKDGITTAREQEIPFLWIDVFCIAHDDDEDRNWHVENLHRIYDEAYLNIALTRSPDISTTALGTRWTNERGEGEVRSIQIDLRRGGKTYPVFVRSKLYACHRTHGMLDDYHLYNYHLAFMAHSPEAVPLFQSAWTFSQRMICRRTVHFDLSELVWDCTSGTLCECTYRQPSESSTVVDRSGHAAIKAAFFRTHLPSRTLALRNLWRRICEEYVKLEIIDPEERLQALISLAIRVQPLVGRAFFAGLFANSSSQLAEELAWTVERHRSRSFTKMTSKTRSRRFPTWSWVSIFADEMDMVRSHEGILYGGFVRDKAFDVLFATSTAPTGATEDNPFNAENWTLRLRGKVASVKISTRPEPNPSRMLPDALVYYFTPCHDLDFPLHPPPLDPVTGRYQPPPEPYKRQPPTEQPSAPRILLQIPPLASFRIALPVNQSGPSHEPRSPSEGVRDRPDLLHPREYTTDTRNGPAQQGIQPLDRHDLTRIGLFTPDCGLWDKGRQQAGSTHTYAYSLLLGRFRLLGEAEDQAIALAVVRVSGVRSGAFERVGLFTAPCTCFAGGQVQELTLV